jgi:diguanylate cyclase (GGDEF)-like protein
MLVVSQALLCEHDTGAMSATPRIDLSAFADSRFAQYLRDGFWSLRFPKDLERQYQEFHLQRVRARVRVFFMLWPLMELYRLLDGVLTGVEDMLSWWLVPNVVVMVLGAIVLWSRWYWRLYLPGATVFATLIIALVAWSIPIDYPGADEMQTLKFTLNVPLLTYLLLGLPFYRATAINIAGAVIYSASVAQTDVATAMLISCVAYSAIVTVVSAVLAYTAERSGRTHFLQERLLGEIASRDGLTGLQNRAAFDAHLERLWKQAQRTQEPIGLLLLDVDHFKGFNDSLGHQAGDACLQRVASIMKTYARRPLDLAARYGGEEFAIILFQTPREQMHAIAEAVRATVEALGIVNPAAPRTFVTVSCGVAVVTPAEGRSMHGLVQAADEALYEAKGSGRNCVRSADSEYSSLATGVFRHRNHLRVVS